MSNQQSAMLTSLLSDPRTPAGQRAAIMSQLQGAQQPQGGGAPPAPQQTPAPPPNAAAPMAAPPVDVMASLRSGAALADQMHGMARGGAVRGYAAGGDVDPDTDPTMDPASTGTGLGGWDPRLMALIKSMATDTPPTDEDKGLALAQAGFGMAASQSPHFGTALGEGALSGVQALQQLKQQRAVQAMRAASMAAGIQQHKDSQQIQREGIQQRRDAAVQTSQDRQDATDARRDAAAANVAARGDAQAALAEQRYAQNDMRRRQQYQQTGQWAGIAGDDTHGISGPPDMSRFDGPTIDDPNVGAKEKQKLIVARPAQTQAVELTVNQLGDMATKADALLKHPGLSKATGFGGDTLSKIPGTEAADAAAALDSLKSSTFVNNLAAMRASSKTGGAVGNVSDKEGDRMSSLQSSLQQAQTEPQIRASLQNIVDYAHRTGATMRDAYVQTYGDKGAPALPWAPKETAAPAAATGPAPPSDEDIKHTAKIHGISEDEVRRRLGLIK